MTLIISMYDKMSDELQQTMNYNFEHLFNILNFVVQQLVEVCEDVEIMSIDNSHTCMPYDQMFKTSVRKVYG